jgi:2,4-dienoyl-CoA reductase-like NADH-dependent reductase (Old Yellow Enzyme family)/thioredoxin reductase
MNTKYPNLFSTLKVGTKTFKNRIESAPAMFAFTSMMPDGLGFFNNRCDERSFRMLEAKAKGGAASVVFGELAPNETTCRRFPFEPAINRKDMNDPNMEVIKKTADMIKKNGAIAIAELVCPGQSKPFLGDGYYPMTASATEREPRGEDIGWTGEGKIPVKEFSKEDIKAIIQDHVDSCIWLREAGWEGILIHAGHGWLPAQFLSPQFNHRTDEYGGSVENRSRFGVELVKAIRENMGKDFLIEVRVSGRERIEGGIGIEDTAKFCQLVEPYTDLIHVSTGHYYKPGRSKEFSTAIDPHGLNVADAAYIKERVNIPVTVVGGINSPEMAEELIASGKVDMVSLGRQLFADPDFPNKALNGQEHLIRRCLRCARCYPGPLGEHETERKVSFMTKLGSCTVNPYLVWPFSHHEDKFPDEYEDIESPKNVLVIGGGVGGIQAAITACDRGHHVTLLEKTDKLGGIINFSEFSEHKQDIFSFMNEIIGELKERTVEIKLNTEATVELVKTMKPNVVIVATGSDTLKLPIPGIENAIPAIDTYYDEFKSLGKTTIILGAGLVGCEASIDYAVGGTHSIIVEKAETLVPDVYGIYRTAVCDKIDELGIEYKVNATVTNIGKNFVEVQYENGDKEVIKADSVVNALGRRPIKDLAEAVKVEIPEQCVYMVGDCQKVAQIGDAISAGWTVAMNIR